MEAAGTETPISVSFYETLREPTLGRLSGPSTVLPRACNKPPMGTLRGASCGLGKQAEGSMPTTRDCRNRGEACGNDLGQSVS